MLKDFTKFESVHVRRLKNRRANKFAIIGASKYQEMRKMQKVTPSSTPKNSNVWMDGRQRMTTCVYLEWEERAC